MTEIEYLLKFSPHIDKFIEIARKNSPSSSYKKAYSIAFLTGIASKIESIGIAKATRKLAIIRRDQGDVAFDKKTSELKSYMKNGNISMSLHPSPSNISSSLITASTKKLGTNQVLLSNKTSEIFKHGNYGWLGKYRMNELMSQINNPATYEQMGFFPLDVFHSCYLINKEFNDGVQVDKLFKKIHEKISNDKEVQKMTMANDLISRVFAVQFLNELDSEIENEIKNDEKNENDDTRDSDNDFNNNDSNTTSNNDSNSFKSLNEVFSPEKMNEMINNSFDRAKQETKETKTIIELFNLTAGKTTEKIAFNKKIKIKNIDLNKLIEKLKKIEFEFKKQKEKETLGIISGIEQGKDLEKIMPTELGEPDDLFYYKVITESFMQYETKIEKKLENILILIDKSGSMKEEKKIIFSRSVAIGVANKYLKMGGNVYLQFFDCEVVPEKPISLRDEKEKFIEWLLTVKNGGGTSIETALLSASKLDINLDKIIIITDGEDEIENISKDDLQYELFSVMVEGKNPDLTSISKKSFTINDDILDIISI